MSGDETNSHSIQVLVHYWELRPAAMAAKLDALIRQGVSHLASFVPWQAVESDISHTLPRFLQAVAERKLTLSLILTPEVGVHYPNSGLPRDLFSKPENTARNVDGNPVAVALPPNLFALPSLTSPEFLKRYHNFLSRIDTLLADLSKTQPWLLEGVTAVLTGSYWKYYRNPMSHGRAFSGSTGDYSGAASVAFRQRVEQHFSSREFQDPTPASANRWKARGLEDVNRRWFYQQSEDVFRWRSSQFLRRKAASLKVSQIELYTPEADPAGTYSSLLQAMAGGRGDFRRLSDLASEYSTRGTSVGDDRAPSYMHWTKLGAFRSLSDSEKQFLILKSLLLMGGQGGGVFIDEAEWLSLSAGFRSRAENLGRMVRQKSLSLGTSAYYLAPHLWSGAGILWDELQTRLPGNARWISSPVPAGHDEHAKLVIVDPACVMTREVVERLVGLASRGKIVALPRSTLYTEGAGRELETAFRSRKAIDMSLGVSYRLEPVGHGKIVLFELPEGLSTQGETLSAWKTFVDSLFSLAGLHSNCRVSDGRLQVVALDKPDGEKGMFIMNGTPHAVNADLFFPLDVTVSDLTLSIAGPKRETMTMVGSKPAQFQGPTSPRVEQRPASRFALEVPPFGILPISVSGLGEEGEERRAARLTGDLMRVQAVDSAKNELPGFDVRGPGMDSVWN